MKLTSRGPVLYRDRRIGVNEREFGMFKFRTMYADADARVGELEAANEAEGALFKIRHDPRVTPVGRFLRRFSLDEFPQVLNVLRGEMSLVGPRPLPLRDYALLDAWHRKRYLVLPGMTGLWQISGRSNLGFDDLVRLDFYYLENWSIWMDVSILLKTMPAVLLRPRRLLEMPARGTLSACSRASSTSSGTAPARAATREADGRQGVDAVDAMAAIVRPLTSEGPDNVPIGGGMPPNYVKSYDEGRPRK